MKKLILYICAFTLILSAGFILFGFEVKASANVSDSLSISAIGVSSGTYATDSDPFNLPRNPDYGELTFDDKLKGYLTDGDVTTFWENTGNFGRNPFNPDINEYIIVDLGEIKKITGVELMASNHGGFPERFSCEYSVSLKEITYAVSSSTTTTAKAPAAGSTVRVDFNGVVARYLRVNFQRVFLHTTYKSIHGVDIFDVCISDVIVYGSEASDTEKANALEKEQKRVLTEPAINSFMVDCSSVLDTKYADGTYAYDPSNLLDKNFSTLWYNAFAATQTPIAEEFIMIQTEDGEAADFREITLYSQTSRDFFPRDFLFQYSFDGRNWLTIEGQTYIDYTDVDVDEWVKISNSKQTFIFEKPVIAKYIRIFITKKSPAFDAASASDYYMIALSEIELRACEISDQKAIVEAEEIFWNGVLGNNDKKEESSLPTIKTNMLLHLSFVFGVSAIAVIGVLVFILFNLKKKGGKGNE